MTSLSYVPTPSKSIMVSQMMHTIVFNFSSLRLHLILSRIQKSRSNSCLVFSQSNSLLSLLLCMLYWPLWNSIYLPQVQSWPIQIWWEDTTSIFPLYLLYPTIVCCGFKLIICQKNAIPVKAPTWPYQDHRHFWWCPLLFTPEDSCHYWWWRTFHVVLLWSQRYSIGFLSRWLWPLQAAQQDCLAPYHFQLQYSS